MTKEELCKRLKEFIAEEEKAWSDYMELMSSIMREIPEARSKYFNEAFLAATAEDERKHAAFLKSISEMAKCE